MTNKAMGSHYYSTDVVAATYAGYIVLPGELKMPIEIAGDLTTLFSKIRASCKVSISCVRDDTAILVAGFPAHVEVAIKDLQDAIRELRTKEAAGHQHLLVQPSDTSACVDGVVVVCSTGSPGEWARPRFQARDRDLPVPVDKFTHLCHEERMLDLFRGGMSTLQAMGTNLKMRANFGFLRLQRRGYAQAQYDLRNFIAVSDTLISRTAAKFDQSLGTGVDGMKILNHFESTFLRTSDNSNFSRPSREPYHLLSLISPDARIEATITPATDKHGNVRQRVTNVEIFRRNWTRLDLNSLSPQMKHDWNLEVVEREPLRPRPVFLENLKKEIFLSFTPETDVFSREPRLSIHANPELAGSIETTILETTVRVRCPNTSYDINISATRTWTGTNTGVKSDPVCTVSICGTNWDERLTSVGSLTQGNWEPELEVVFSEGEATFKTGFVKLIQLVKYLQAILGEIHPGDPDPGHA